MSEHGHHALFSHAAYHPGGRAAEMVAHTGYQVDGELSNRNRTAFHHPGTGHTVVAFRGTNPFNPFDWIANSHILRGTEWASSRFRTSHAVVRKANKKYGIGNVTVTGHSLGGSQALDVNRRLGNDAVAYNPGAGLGDLTRDIVARAFGPAIKKKATATILSAPGDPIGTLGLFSGERRVWVKPRTKNPHSLKNFL
ncbi:g8136 [Coccomyxa viridis]|uniref:G8136 protein n=1 Tax=Coccomyxa viridis TaxID=1274662 RepID=A0ABP1FZR8_9CHLO